MKFRIGIYLAAWMFLMPWAALGQDAAKEEDKVTTVKIVLHPMSEPSPALKYQLLPPLIDRKPGNAAVLYNKVPAQWDKLFSSDEMDKVFGLREIPLSEMRKKDVRELLNNYGLIIEDIIRAAYCEYCDWQIPIHEQEFWSIPLPELQQNRIYARLLEMKARLQIVDGKYDEAVQTLQAGYALARHVATGPMILHGILGCLMTRVMSDQVQEFIQQPDAPNLYWALSSLPRPFIDIHQGLEGERNALYLSYPELRDLDKKNYSPQQWQLLLDEIAPKLVKMMKEIGGKQNSVESSQIISIYPKAKAFLIERGWEPGKVEAMPVAQVTLIAIFRQYEEIRDDVFKWLLLSNPSGITGVRQAQQIIEEVKNGNQEFIPIATILAQPLSRGVKIEIMMERDIAVLRVFEALRLYGASHKGKLAEKLSDITEVPVPIDPLNDKPFIYHCQGNTATLESPAPQGLSSKDFGRRYEIQFVTKEK